MKKITTVLIALDYSSTTQKVAEIGYQFAKSMNAEIILLHVLSNPAYYASTVYDPIMGFGGFMNLNLMESSLLDNLKTTAQLFLNKSKSHLADETIQTIIEEGDVADCILEVAKNNKAGLIIMGSHSRKWLEQVLLGSTAEDVLHKTTLPLLIIPTKK